MSSDFVGTSVTSYVTTETGDPDELSWTSIDMNSSRHKLSVQPSTLTVNPWVNDLEFKTEIRVTNNDVLIDQYWFTLVIFECSATVAVTDTVTGLPLESGTQVFVAFKGEAVNREFDLGTWTLSNSCGDSTTLYDDVAFTSGQPPRDSNNWQATLIVDADHADATVDDHPVTAKFNNEAY